jgi:hypothetical protein
VLLDKGAEVNAVTKDGDTPLQHRAAENGCRVSQPNLAGWRAGWRSGRLHIRVRSWWVSRCTRRLLVVTGWSSPVSFNVLGPVPEVRWPRGLLDVGNLFARMAVLRSCALGI